MHAALDRFEVEPHAPELGAKALQPGGELGGQAARVAQQLGACAAQRGLYVAQLLRDGRARRRRGARRGAEQPLMEKLVRVRVRV